ncbi:MAG: ATP-binding protein, partial [Mariniblastus sp.]|nr:ATP-binding protein [Mariniblastus sp.]
PLLADNEQAAASSKSESVMDTDRGEDSNARWVSSETVDWIAQAKSNIQMMCETALATSLHTEMDLLIERLMDLVFSWITADRACVILKDTDTGEWVVKSSRQRSVAEAGSVEFAVWPAVLDYVLEKEEGIFSPNQKLDPRLASGSGQAEAEDLAVICVPIRGRNEISGMIYVDCDPRDDNSSRDSVLSSFNPEQLKMLLAIGHQAAVAIENTGYYSMLLKRERSTAVGEVMESLSHYIKNVLQSINGGTHLIECGLKEQEYDLVEKGWQIVQRNQEYLSGLVMDMLAHSKPRAPKMAPGDINQLLESALRLLERRAEHCKVSLEWQSLDKPPSMQFDSQVLERAFQNIMLTAINTCRDNGAVNVSVEMQPNSQSIQVRIHNNGSDVPAEQLKTMFDPLAINENSNLMGIAMAVSQKSIMEHGGTIVVLKDQESRIVFDVTLPW